jgi:hypothetical protein
VDEERAEEEAPGEPDRDGERAANEQQEHGGFRCASRSSPGAVSNGAGRLPAATGDGECSVRQETAERINDAEPHRLGAPKRDRLRIEVGSFHGASATIADVEVEP